MIIEFSYTPHIIINGVKYSYNDIREILCGMDIDELKAFLKNIYDCGYHAGQLSQEDWDNSPGPLSHWLED